MDFCAYIQVPPPLNMCWTEESVLVEAPKPKVVAPPEIKEVVPEVKELRESKETLTDPNECVKEDVSGSLESHHITSMSGATIEFTKYTNSDGIEMVDIHTQGDVQIRLSTLKECLESITEKAVPEDDLSIAEADRQAEWDACCVLGVMFSVGVVVVLASYSILYTL